MVSKKIVYQFSLFARFWNSDRIDVINFWKSWCELSCLNNGAVFFTGGSQEMPIIRTMLTCNFVHIHQFLTSLIIENKLTVSTFTVREPDISVNSDPILVERVTYICNLLHPHIIWWNNEYLVTVHLCQRIQTPHNLQTYIVRLCSSCLTTMMPQMRHSWLECPTTIGWRFCGRMSTLYLHINNGNCPFFLLQFYDYIYDWSGMTLVGQLIVYFVNKQFATSRLARISS